MFSKKKVFAKNLTYLKNTISSNCWIFIESKNYSRTTSGGYSKLGPDVLFLNKQGKS